MARTRDTLVVYLPDPNAEDTDAAPLEKVATITHQDMVRGEKAHHDAGFPTEGGYLALTTAWCWASLMRQGDYSGPFQRFCDIDCAGLEKGDPATVDPTQQATP
jgi:hypothetical protein